MLVVDEEFVQFATGAYTCAFAGNCERLTVRRDNPVVNRSPFGGFDRRPQVPLADTFHLVRPGNTEALLFMLFAVNDPNARLSVGSL